MDLLLSFVFTIRLYNNIATKEPETTRTRIYLDMDFATATASNIGHSVASNASHAGDSTAMQISLETAFISSLPLIFYLILSSSKSLRNSVQIKLAVGSFGGELRAESRGKSSEGRENLHVLFLSTF